MNLQKILLKIFNKNKYFQYKDKKRKEDNKDLYEQKIKIELEKINYKENDIYFLNLNQDLKEIANKHNIIYLENNDFACDDVKKKCDILTDLNEKIYWDTSHYTLEGAKYFGKKIHDLNWFNIK